MNKFSLGEWVISVSPLSRPEKLMIEVTMKCNLSCSYCFRNSTNEYFGTMGKELYDKIVNEAKEARVKWFIFSGWGEPLTHPNILEFIKEAKEAGIKVVLNTNGTLLKKFNKHLIDLGVDEVVVSVDAAEAEIHGRLRGGNLIEIINGLIELYELRRRYSHLMRVGLEFTLTRLNRHELLKLIDLAKKVGASYIRLSNIIPIRKELEDHACYNDEECRRDVEKYMDVISKLSLEHNVQVYQTNLELKAQRACPFAMYKVMFIRWDGLVTPCIHYAHDYVFWLFGIERRVYKVVFGDLHKESITDIWLNPDYVKFRFRALTGYQPSCLDCVLVEYCNLTLNNIIDCWANTPTCAHCPFIYGLTACPL